MTGSTPPPVLRPAAPDAKASPAPSDLPSVGVVIPTRNRPELMLRALDAVLAQDYQGALRIIVVYDGTPPDYLLPRATPHPVMVLRQLAYARASRARVTPASSVSTPTSWPSATTMTSGCRANCVRRSTRSWRLPSGTEFVTCAIEVHHDGNIVPRLAGQTTVCSTTW